MTPIQTDNCTIFFNEESFVYLQNLLQPETYSKIFDFVNKKMSFPQLSNEFGKCADVTIKNNFGLWISQKSEKLNKIYKF